MGKGERGIEEKGGRAREREKERKGEREGRGGSETCVKYPSAGISVRCVCCSVVQCVAVWCSVVQCGAVCCSVVQ